MIVPSVTATVLLSESSVLKASSTSHRDVLAFTVIGNLAVARGAFLRMYEGDKDIKVFVDPPPPLANGRGRVNLILVMKYLLPT